MSDNIKFFFHIHQGLMKTQTVDQTLNHSSGNNFMKVTVANEKSTTLEKVFNEVSEAFLKDEYCQSSNVSATLDGAEIEQEHYNLSLDELEVKKDDIITVRKKEAADIKKTKTGAFWLLNRTDKTFKIQLKTLVPAEENIPERSIRVLMPNAAVPTPAGEVSIGLGEVDTSTGEIRLNLDVIKEQIKIYEFTCSPHAPYTVEYPNWTVDKYPSSFEYKVFPNDGRAPEHWSHASYKSAYMIGDANGVLTTVPTKVKNPIRGHKYPTWKPLTPDPTLTDGNPHKGMAKDSVCGLESCYSNAFKTKPEGANGTEETSSGGSQPEQAETKESSTLDGSSTDMEVDPQMK